MAHGLRDIDGPDYRKALEVLIKDSLIEESPDQSVVVKKKLLGPCIAKLVKNENVKLVATRAAWL
ncbi:hypothetical protein BH10CYA1_BH10CYA1_64750 [soil metagenome]